VTFVDVPEVSPNDLDSVFRGIRLRRRLRLPSFGAYVLRQGGREVAMNCLERLSEGRGTDTVYNTVSFGGDQPDGRLHRDRGVKNDATIHLTTSGAADAIVLAGLIHYEPTPTSTEELDQAFRATAELYNTGTLDHGVLPRRSLRTTLEANDVLIFDHTQLHAFRSLGDNRQSIALFF
jgi:hypothetical protein